MARSKLNKAQAKLLANFSADLAKGVMLASISLPYISKEVLIFRGALVLSYLVIAILLLKLSIELLKGVKQ